jgi:hypothetical protein
MGEEWLKNEDFVVFTFYFLEPWIVSVGDVASL